MKAKNEQKAKAIARSILGQRLEDAVEGEPESDGTELKAFEITHHPAKRSAHIETSSVDDKPYVLVAVLRGLAEVVEAPSSVEVEVVDLDTFAAMGGNLDAFLADGHASQHAMDILRDAFVRRVRESGQEYVHNGHTIHLGHYVIDRIEPDGTVHAGCHVVKWDEIERIAPQLVCSVQSQA